MNTAIKGTIKNRISELEESDLKDAWKSLKTDDAFVSSLISTLKNAHPHVKKELRDYLFRHMDYANRLYVEQQVNVKSTEHV